MSQMTLVGFCAAMGFVVAGTVASFYRLVTAEPADFGLPRKSAPGVALSIALSMFAGPFIVVSKVLAGLKSSEITILPAAVGVIVAGMWSVCAGIFYISLLVGV